MKNERPVVIFIIGGPGTGKGTQCKKLAQAFGMVHLSIGDILREQRVKDTDEGRELDKYMLEYEKNGRLMPTKYILNFVKIAMKESGWEKNIYLLDGFIKTLEMAKAWDDELGDIIELKRVIYYVCPNDVMEQRLINRGKTENRADDNLDMIRKRIKMYNERTVPVVDLYKKRGLLTTIHSDDSIEEVYAESRDALKLAMDWY